MKKLCVGILLLTLASCATIVAPNGGPQDRTAPKIVTSTLPDSSVNFKGGIIKMAFDENILSTGIVLDIFPLTSVPPKVSVSKKTLSINLPDSLLENNTTYNLNFGNTVKDIYEGTAYNNLSLTFSTGGNIDSLFLQGNVVQASTGIADTGTQVLLYSKINSDSDVTFKRPLYVSKVDEQGKFLITNLPDKAFYIYAVKNTNNNYVYDAPGERIAFADARVQPHRNMSETITLLSFTEKADTNKNKVNIRKGIAPNIAGIKVNIDTTAGKRTFDVTQAITIEYPKKIDSVDVSKIRLFQDSILDASATIKLDSTKKIISVSTEFLQDANYKLQLLEGYVIDSVKSKAATYAFKTKKEVDYGIIKVQYKKDLSGYKRILQLWFEDKLIGTRTISAATETFTMLNPGSYTLRVIQDANNNGIWDNGSFKNTLRQPEKTEAYSTPILLKANMENKIVWEEGKAVRK